MKLGSAVMFMFLAFIALGFLLSENFNTYEDLAQSQRLNQKLSDDNASLQSENAALVQALAESEQRVNDLTRANLAQQEKNDALAEENSTLQAVVSGPQCQGEDSASTENPVNAWLAWALLIPVIPASLAASYGIVYYTRNNYGRPVEKGRRTEYIQLTGEEIEKVIQMRRRK